MSHKVLRYPKPPTKLIPLNNEKDLQDALSWDARQFSLLQMVKKQDPAMTLEKFRARRKRNRLARKNRKRNAA